VVDQLRVLTDAQKTPFGFMLSRAGANLLKAAGFLVLAALLMLILRTGAAKRSLVRAWRCCGYLYQIARSWVGKT
jgi:hypothetical protein